MENLDLIYDTKIMANAINSSETSSQSLISGFISEGEVLELLFPSDMSEFNMILPKWELLLGEADQGQEEPKGPLDNRNTDDRGEEDKTSLDSTGKDNVCLEDVRLDMMGEENFYYKPGFVLELYSSPGA